VEALPVVLALVLAACGGSDAANTTTTTAPATTTMASTTTDAPTTTGAATTTAAPATTAGDLPTELRGGTYLVGSEILPGVWIADACGCAWATVDENGVETLGSGDDAIVPEDAYAMRLGGCEWTWGG
jgi:hypothetical protein